jgi:geranylgeranyl reductase family protein
MFDVAIVGGGPAGATCAAFCAAAGLRTLVLERAVFPREKVCGDCLNPACWPILRRLELAERLRSLPHDVLDRVEFISVRGTSVTLPLPEGDAAEITVKRSLFDQMMLERARELGADVYESTPVTATNLEARKGIWTIATPEGNFQSHLLVAADGRNSTIARLCNLRRPIAKERIALQTHVPLPNEFGRRVVLQFLPGGYSGQAPVGNGELNVCLVSVPRVMPGLRSWAEANFGISPKHCWRTITTLTRAPIDPAHRNLFLVGDAARVVEPFTGEGIYYALASGELAANAIISGRNGHDQAAVSAGYSAAQTKLYDGRLWINRLARLAVLSPRYASLLLEILRFQPAPLRLLTSKIVHNS